MAVCHRAHLLFGQSWCCLRKPACRQSLTSTAERQLHEGTAKCRATRGLQVSAAETSLVRGNQAAILWHSAIPVPSYLSFETVVLAPE